MSSGSAGRRSLRFAGLIAFAGDHVAKEFEALAFDARQLDGLERILAGGGLVVAEIDPSQAGIGMDYVSGVTGLPVTVRQDAFWRDRFLLAGNWA